MKVDSRPTSPQKIAGQHAALTPRHPDKKNPSPDSKDQNRSVKPPWELESLYRRSNSQGMLLSTSDAQGRVSSPSGHTSTGVAGSERIFTRSTLPNWPPVSSSYQKSTATTSGSNGKKSRRGGAPIASSNYTVEHIPGQLPPQKASPPEYGVPVCVINPSVPCW
ncbi:uncharacterized protein PGTG_09558 [Puccinia graminis f. sp. tritici CRL 75-36-700-3]|uniref:Uncharacterized protein n=1 Tax=Puccinia graminis f. sp. tritici (strain CRL 75-36-700-3 / race SCCL) TaxID=418459 RepID=E3KHS0_PUCGT|nr:uncharacterized protein PGTG_09558 [Puccinia graminis f. sp. tritici CRL 75-36-700-3]EFP83845.2 hypothetical protein PGTG_09558 [Puccinia graminis f. sp. tritici CRL 75-36-700-3]